MVFSRLGRILAVLVSCLALLMAVSPPSAWAKSAAPAHLAPNRLRTEEANLTHRLLEPLSPRHILIHGAPQITLIACTEPHLQAEINSASPGERIYIDCGDIPFSEPLTIPTNNLTLVGQGQNVTFDGQNKVQDIIVNADITLSLENLTIAKGSASKGSGGGLSNNGGTVNISNSTVSNNKASGNGGGLSNNGGTMTITNSTITNNNNTASSGYGGGIFNSRGTMTITNSTITNNTASFSGYGGGISNVFAGKVNINHSTITDNSTFALGYGGGLFNQGGHSHHHQQPHRGQLGWRWYQWRRHLQRP
jgi:Right handed beta helix region